MSLTEETAATVEEDNQPSDRERNNLHSESTASLEDFMLLAWDEWPARISLPLNSNRLNLHKWQAIALFLEVSIDAAMLTETISDSENLYCIWLMKGALLREQFGDESCELGASKCSVLHDTSGLVWLCPLVSKYELVIENLRDELQLPQSLLMNCRLPVPMPSGWQGKLWVWRKPSKPKSWKLRDFGGYAANKCYERRTCYSQNCQDCLAERTA